MLRCASAGLTEGDELSSIEAQTTDVQCACWCERLEMVVRRELNMLIERVAFWVEQSCC